MSDTSSAPERLRRSAPLALLLFGFWLLLSGELDAFHLGLGAASALLVARLTEPLLFAAPPIASIGVHPVTGQPWLRLARYLPWLTLQVVQANLHVARIVLAPGLPIDPQLVRFRHPLPHNLGRLTLSSSITLTPGTVTLDVEGDEYLVHALTPDMARSLDPEGIPGRVSALFEEDEA